MTETEKCPKCGSPLGDVVETPTGRKLQRCSTGSWNKETKKTEGCDYVKWLEVEPKELDEKCPKCGAELSPVAETKTGRQLQRCSKGNWNPDTKKNEGCDYVKWLEVKPQELDEKCPKCGKPLVLNVTRFGKKMKKCSTNVWNAELKKAEGCDYIEWINGTTENLAS